VQFEVPSEGHPLVAEVRAAQEEVLWRLRGVEGASTMPGRVFIRWAACQAVQEVPVSGAEAEYRRGDFPRQGGVCGIEPASVGGGIGSRLWRVVVPLLPVGCGLLPDAAAEPGGGDGDACRWLTFGRQLGQRIGLLISGDASVSGYPVYRYLYHVGSEGERRVANQGGDFLPGAVVETCRAGNGGLVV
jgi:hypothetical protein